jgi:hypothetical protein
MGGPSGGPLLGTPRDRVLSAEWGVSLSIHPAFVIVIRLRLARISSVCMDGDRDRDRDGMDGCLYCVFFFNSIVVLVLVLLVLVLVLVLIFGIMFDLMMDDDDVIRFTRIVLYCIDVM